jgi:hypothetical protein
MPHDASATQVAAQSGQASCASPGKDRGAIGHDTFATAEVWAPVVTDVLNEHVFNEHLLNEHQALVGATRFLGR